MGLKTYRESEKDKLDQLFWHPLDRIVGKTFVPHRDLFHVFDQKPES